MNAASPIAARVEPRDGARSAVDLERPVLVCGVGRSGTSLLQSMLNAHPELAFPPETHFFRRHVMPGELDAWGGPEREALRMRLADDTDFARAGVDPAVVLAADSPLGGFRALLAEVARAQGKRRVGDKDPRSIDCLPELARAFPEARVVHVVRDPRDVLVSRMKAAWSAHRPWWVHPLIQAEQLRRGRTEGPACFGERYLEVRYLELDFVPEMLDFGASARSLVDARELSWKKETLGPLLAGNAGKWRAALTPFQVAWTEAVCAESFDELGYRRADGGSALLDAAAAAGRAAMRRAYAHRAGGRA
jgi:hypothetical protein